MVKLPKKGASREEFEAFKTALGIPLKSEDYDLEGLKVPSGFEMTDERLKYLREVAFGAGLTKNQAKTLLANLMLWQAEEANRFDKAMYPDTDKLDAEFKDEWGADYVSNRSAYMRYLREFADDELRELANNSPLGSNKSFIRSGVRVGKMIGESPLIEGRSTPEKSEDEEDYDHSPELKRRR